MRPLLVAILVFFAALRGRDWPLVVLSHGSGNSFAGHADTALALAETGFIVTAPTHPGDNFRDHRPGGRQFLRRP